MVGRPGARKATSRPPKSTRWLSTTSILIASTGPSRTTPPMVVPSLPLGNGQDFRAGPGCETGPIIPDPLNPEIVYGGCKGQFSRQNLSTTNEERYWIGGQSLYGNAGTELMYRFQRVSPMEVSPHDSKVVYYAPN